MSTTLHLSIISPTQSLFDGAAAMVEIPGAEGDFAVLPQHAPVLSSLREGVIKVHGADKSVQSFDVTNGYVDMADNNCTILL